MKKEINLPLIREKREKFHKTYSDMAEALGLSSREKYYRRETGKYKFQAGELPALAKELDIPLEKIFK